MLKIKLLISVIFILLNFLLYSSNVYKNYLCSEVFGLPQVQIYDVHQATGNQIWVSTEIGLFYLKNGSFIQYKLPKEFNKDIWGIREDNKGNIWLLSYGNKISFIDKNKKNIVLDIKVEGNIENVIMINDGVLLSFYQPSQIYKYHFSTKKIEKLNSNLVFYVELANKNIIEYKSNNRLREYNTNFEIIDSLQEKEFDLYSTIYKKIYYSGQFRFAHKVLYPLFKKKFFNHKGNLIFDNEEYMILNYSVSANEKYLCFNTNKGIICLDQTGKRYYGIENIILDYYNKTKVIPIIYSDLEQNIWLIDKTNLIFYPNYFISQQIIVNDNNLSNISLFNDSIFFFTKKNEVFEFNIFQNKRKKITNNDKNCSKLRAYNNCLVIDFNDELTSFFDLNTQKKNNVLIAAKNFTLLNDSIIIISSANLIASYNINKKIIEKIDSVNFRISSLAELNNSLILATRQGKLINYSKENILCDSFSIEIKQILKISDNNLFISSYSGGGYIYNFKTKHLKKLEFLSEKIVNKAINGEKKDEFWILSVNGEFMKIIGNEMIVAFDNLKINNAILDFCISKNSLIYLTENNICKVNIKQMSDKITLMDSLKVVSINNISVNNNFSCNFYEGDKLNIIINNKLINRLPGLKIFYKIKKIGVKEPNVWNELLNNNLELDYLSPGHYTVFFKTKNKYSHPVSLSFNVILPFYKELWFILIVSLFLLLVIFFFYRKRAKQKEKLRLQLARLEIKSVQAQINPHFFSNALLSIQYLINKNKILEANKFLNKFAKLMRQTLNVADYPEHIVAKEIEILEHYLNLEKLRIPNLEYLITHQDIDIYSELFPSMVLQPLIENAIKHGIEPNNKKGLVKVIFSKPQKNILICEVVDNGVGIQKKNNTLYQSKGLKIIKEKIELVCEKNKWTGYFLLKSFNNHENRCTKATIKIVK